MTSNRKNKPKVTACPGAAYQEYAPQRDPRMVQAVERARRDQPSLMTMASNVPSYQQGEK